MPDRTSFLPSQMLPQPPPSRQEIRSLSSTPARTRCTNLSFDFLWTFLLFPVPRDVLSLFCVISSLFFSNHGEFYDFLWIPVISFKFNRFPLIPRNFLWFPIDFLWLLLEIQRFATVSFDSVEFPTTSTDFLWFPVQLWILEDRHGQVDRRGRADKIINCNSAKLITFSFTPSLQISPFSGFEPIVPFW